MAPVRRINISYKGLASLNYNISSENRISLSWFSWGSSVLVELESDVLVFVEGEKHSKHGENPNKKLN